MNNFLIEEEVMSQTNTQVLKGRHILVTGGGYGIGRDAALTYAAAGATVLLLGRTTEALNDTYDMIEAAGYPQAAVLPFDLENKDEEAFIELAGLIQEHFGHLPAEPSSELLFLHPTLLLSQQLLPFSSYRA